MKCKVCRGRAVLDVRRHNAAFCKDHFFDHARGQVEKMIDKFRMFSRDERLLVAVSGGKDSLVLWDMLLDMGYDATGFYLDLGIGGYSTRSGETVRAFAATRDAKLIERDLRQEHGFDVPGYKALMHRVACSGCGLSKRYEFNRVALEEGFDVLVTGHNLDDEAAVLFSNLLQWNSELLARQYPVLEERAVGAGRALVRKVKPLVRLGERETAAYAVLRGIDYVVDECPFADGNTLNKYKDILVQIEQTSPGSKHQLYFGFLREAAARFADASGVADLVPCGECGAPTVTRGDRAPRCSFCAMRARVLARKADG